MTDWNDEGRGKVVEVDEGACESNDEDVDALWQHWRRKADQGLSLTTAATRFDCPGCFETLGMLEGETGDAQAHVVPRRALADRTVTAADRSVTCRRCGTKVGEAEKVESPFILLTCVIPSPC